MEWVLVFWGGEGDMIGEACRVSEEIGVSVELWTCGEGKAKGDIVIGTLAEALDA